MAFDLIEMGKETTYNTANPAMRRGMIIGNSDVKNEAVAAKLAVLDYADLKGFQRAGQRNSNDATFNQNWDRLDRLIKTNPAVMGSMVDQYKTDQRGYAAALGDLADNFEANPKFATTMLARLEAHPETAGAEFAKYKSSFARGTVTNYIQSTLGETTSRPAAPVLDAATVVAGATGAAAAPAAPAPTRKPSGKPVGQSARDMQLERMRRQLPPETSTPVAAASAATAVVAASDDGVIDEMTPEAAKKKFGAFAANPANKDFMDLIRQNKLEGDIDGILSQDPDRVRTLLSPGGVKRYTGMLKDGKKDEFLDAFAGKDKEQAVDTQALMGMFSTGIDAAAVQQPWLKDLKKWGMGFLGGTMDMFYKVSGSLSSGPSGNITAMLNNPDNKAFAEAQRKGIPGVVNPYDEHWLGELAKDAQSELRSDNPAIRRHGATMLAAHFGVKGNDMAALADDKATVYQTRIVEEVDPKTRVKNIRALADVRAYTPEELTALAIKQSQASARGTMPAPNAAPAVASPVVRNDLPSPQPVIAGEGSA